MVGHEPAKMTAPARPVIPWPHHLATPLARALTPLLLAGIFFLANGLPIHHLDTWSHWKYGEWIWQHGRLPTHEPFSPYSDRQTPLYDTWWLSQVLCYLVYSRLGMEGIALFYGIVTAARTALYLVAFRRLSGSLLLAVLTTVLMQVGLWEFFGNFRPQVLGELCWAALLAVLSTPYGEVRRQETEDRRQEAGGRGQMPGIVALVLIPLIVALWANLHGAFPLAFVLLGTLLVGRFLDQAWTLRNPIAALRQADVQRWAAALGLAVVAACANPYGPKLLLAALNFGKMPVLDYVNEWQPVPPLSRLSSVAFAGAVGLALVTARLSPRRFSAADVLLLVGFALPAWLALRMIPWWLTICPFVLLPHWKAILDKITSRKDLGPANGAQVLQLSGVLLAVALLLGSGTARWLARGVPRPVEQQVSVLTPVRPAEAIKAWLAKDGPRTPMTLRVFSASVWGDYFLWDLPPSATVYRYSHWNCYSPQRMTDAEHLLLCSGPPHDWRRLIDQYRLNALALRGDGRSSLLFDYLLREAERPESEWQILYQGDDLGVGERERPAALVAVRRVDPFGTTLLKAQAAQGCVGGLGMTPWAGQWGILTHLPWHWKASRESDD